jgi:hypothetical protein
MECIDNGTLVFDGQDYEIWISIMKVCVYAHGYDVLKSIVTGYTASKKPLETATKKELRRNKK